MSNFTSLLKKVGFLALTAFPLCASARDSISIRDMVFSPQFIQQMQADGIQLPIDFKIALFEKEEDAVFPEDLNTLPSVHLDMKDGRFSLKKDFKVPAVDSLNLYYILYSPNIQMEKGCMKFKMGEKNRIFPEDFCKKVVLKNSVGVDGMPVSTQFIFMGGYDCNNRFINLAIRKTSEAAIQLLIEKETDPDTGETLIPEAKTSAFWTNPGREIPYVVYNDGCYFMQDAVYKMTDAEVADTICLDYRKAKKVSFGVKDVKGEQLDMRRLAGNSYAGFNAVYFQNKYSTGPVLMEENEKGIVGRMSTEDIPFDHPIETVDFYAFPGEYIFSFWALNFADAKNHLCPAGLEGRLVVSDAAEQRVDWDLSKYYTLNVKSNVAPGFKGLNYNARNAKSSAGTNALLSHFDFTDLLNMADAYKVISEDPEKQGEYQVKIWPAVGYDTVDIKGAIHDYELTLKAADFNQQKEAVVNVPNMYTIRCYIPSVLQDMDTQLNINDKQYTVGYAPYRPDMVDIPRGAFEKMKVYSYAKLPGYYRVNFEVKKSVGGKAMVYSSDVKEVKLGNTDQNANLPWNRAVIFDYKNAELSYNFAEGVNAFELSRTRNKLIPGDPIEILYVFDKAGDAGVELIAPAAVPQKQVVKVPNGFHYQSLDFVNYGKFALTAEGGKTRFVNVTWNGKDSSSYVLAENVRIDANNPQKYYAEKGIMDILVQNYGTTDRRNTTVNYPFKVDMNECDSLVLPDLFRYKVNFFRGEKPAFIHGYYQSTNTIDGEVDLYYLSSPYVDNTKPLECVIHRNNRCPHTVILMEGSYCAVDSLGTKIYFTLPGEATGNINFEFDNSPTPPTGVEEMPEVEVPVAYYDLSGRRLVAPRKGVNLIRLQNGKIKKVMMK